MSFRTERISKPGAAIYAERLIPTNPYPIERTPPMTISDERIAELQKEIRTLIRPGFLCLPIGEADALLAIARVRRCEAAECEAWRKWERGLWQDLEGVAKPQPPYTTGPMRDLTEARAATDAARREMEGR